MRFVGAGFRKDIEYRVLDTFWTLPNVVTLVRFLLVPLFVWLVAVHEYAWATAVLAFLGSTDWVDGYLARRLNQISRVGTWLDPLADRLSLFIVAATFTVAGLAPLWFVYAVIVPDVVLVVNALILFRGSPELPVTLLGKLRTAVLMAATPLVLLSRVPGLDGGPLGAVATVLLATGAALHVAASAGYLVQAHRKAAARRHHRTWSG